MNKFFLLAFTFVVSALGVQADSWALAEKETICSKNNRFCFKVIPKKLSGQLEYFQDKVAGKENAGADKRVKKNLARGIFYRRDDQGILRKRWEINLLNEVAPVSVLVSDAGDHIVTFDNWHSVGYGDDVVVIYEGATGRLIKNLGLTDFLTESDVNRLPHSVSSIWWGGKHSIDRVRNELILRVNKSDRTSAESDKDFFPIRIDLGSGKVLDEKTNRFPILKLHLLDKVGPKGVDDSILPAEFRSCIESNSSSFEESEKLLARVVKKVLPDYPPAAAAVRAQGEVTVGVVIDQNGGVVCSSAVTGHPLLRAALAKAAKEWTFQPGEKPVYGWITFAGGWSLVAPDGSVIDQSGKP